MYDPKKILIFVLVLILAGVGIFFGVKAVADKIRNPGTQNQPVSTQPTIAPTFGANQPVQPGNPTAVSQPGSTTLPVQPVQPPQNAAGTANVLCQAGTNLPQLNVTFDDYPGFYPLVYRIAAMPASDRYCINLFPKWSGPNFDQNGFSEAQIEGMIRSGEMDVYFASNGALALWDANSGLVVWSTDQSAGADAIIARNNVSQTGHPNFNDALGRTIVLSRGSADHYFMLKALQAAGFLTTDVNFQFSDSPVKDFVSGQGDFVSYWDPIILDAMTADNTVLVTTKDWRTISDYVVVSHQADTNKSDALAYFLADYNIATEAFTVQNLPATANVLANWQFNGQPMVDWLWMSASDPNGSLTRLMSTVAISRLSDNANMFEKDGSGWSLVKDQFDKTHATWQYGQVYDNADGTKGSLYNSDTFISDKYVKILVKGKAKNVGGDFSNPYITDVNENLPNVDNNMLFTLPELLTLKYKNIQFVEGQARTLVPGEVEKLMALVQPIANLMAESPDSVIVIKGGHGFFSTDAGVMAQQAKFAFRRALYIREILSDPHGLNIPFDRIVIDPNVVAPDHEPTAAELPNYIVVIIRVVNAGNLK